MRAPQRGSAGMRSGPRTGDVGPPRDAAPPPTPIWISYRLRNALVVGAILLPALAAWLVPSILTVALGGVALALVLSYPVRWLSRLLPRNLAILVVLLLLLGGVALALAVLVPLLIDQLTDLVAAWPSILDRIGQLLDDLADALRERGLLPESETTLSERLRQGLRDRSQEIAARLLTRVLGLATGAIGFAIQAFGVLFVATYLLVDVGRVRRAYRGLAPARYRPDADALWDAFGASISRYLGGVLFVAAFQGGLTAVALWVLGVPYALLLGVWVALTSVIPYLGAILGAVPAVPLALAESPTTAVLTVVLYVLIQTLESNVLTPRVQGQATRVHPIFVLLTVLWAGQAFGLLGSALAVPALVVARVLFDFFRDRLRVRPDRERARPRRSSGSAPPADTRAP